ncbi:hypothetical protein SLA2020_271500 [Shorea laevis]
MQLRLATATVKRLPLLLSLAHNQALRVGLASSSAGRTFDRDIHSEEVEVGPDVYYRKNEVRLFEMRGLRF